MKILKLNLIALVLLPIALLTFSTSALSFVLCFGDDGHTRVEQASVNGCGNCEEARIAHEDYKANNLSSRVDERTQSCSDLLLSNDSLTFKRIIKKSDTPTLEESRANLYTPSNVQYIPKTSIVQLPRISQTILAHRTVVLLN